MSVLISAEKLSSAKSAQDLFRIILVDLKNCRDQKQRIELLKKQVEAVLEREKQYCNKLLEEQRRTMLGQSNETLTTLQAQIKQLERQVQELQEANAEAVRMGRDLAAERERRTRAEADLLLAREQLEGVQTQRAELDRLRGTMRDMVNITS
jgi:DNA repair exonuclease SbcCD ATPase subunit